MPRMPTTGRCYCRPGVARDNCSNCEGTGIAIDWAEFHRRKREPRPVLAEVERDAYLCYLTGVRDEDPDGVMAARDEGFPPGTWDVDPDGDY